MKTQHMQQIQIFCDFDGTVTKGDTVDLLLETLALKEWRDLEALWIKGKISARECMSRQIPLIQGGWEAIEKVLETVEFDRGFASFVTWCRNRQIPFTIVSDGLDRVINSLLRRENVRVNKIWASQLLEDESGLLRLEFPQRDHRTVCPSGQCKCQVLDMAPRDVLKVVIGDGRSDFCWARNADLLFAKDSLLKHCKTEGIACKSYDSLLEVRMGLEELIPVAVPVSTPVEHFGNAAWVGA